MQYSLISSVRHVIMAASLGMTLIYASPSLANDQQELMQIQAALKAGELISIQQAIEIAEKAIPGQVIDVDLDIEYTYFVYEIQLLDQSGIKRKMVINAKTSEILSKY